jgi:hypothetical protein
MSTLPNWMLGHCFSQHWHFENTATLVIGRHRQVRAWDTALNIAFVHLRFAGVKSLLDNPEPQLRADAEKAYEFVFRHGKNRIG